MKLWTPQMDGHYFLFRNALAKTKTMLIHYIPILSILLWELAHDISSWDYKTSEEAGEKAGGGGVNELMNW